MLIPEVGRKKFHVRLVIGIITGFLWLGIILHLIPFWWMITTSFKPYYEVFSTSFLPPRHPTLVAYKLIFSIPATARDVSLVYPLWVYLKNSAIYTGTIMFFQIVGTALVAYSLSKLQSPRWSRLLFLFFIGTMLIPGQISLIPRYLIISHFPFPTKHIPNIPFTNIAFPHHNFLNSYWAVILPMLFSPFYVLLFKGFFDGIPNELINAARLDGSSEMGIFRRIILPLSKPVFAVVSYFSFSAIWNEFMWPLIVLQNQKLYPISVQLYMIQRVLSHRGMTTTGTTDPDVLRFLEAGTGYNGLMALAIIESIPVFIMFIIFREQLMKGIKLRGFK